MIWIALGIVSVFWDKPMGEYLPLISTMLFGAFWIPIHPVLILAILYFHYLLGVGSGAFEILSISILAVVMMIEDLFYSKTFLYILYALSVSSLILMNYGTFSAAISLIEALLVLRMYRDTL